ncbi:three-Cys-motif partner protein [Paenibacillus algorifonticola]|uniref:Three-Cys-motif partner protein n=1 Tax=Paenibacillus algorifonticola TaxID=684063 RepID=A0A1I2H3K9_9BACL|nr:three-Cys-motif partner protein TcmP [Paenibacillus algorifonticola]SFF23386.1 three-Cys-motif partner protein [Paenibacillus algorifonticola]
MNLLTWEMKSHTKAKHVVLENYLKAWFPIMAHTFERIIYIDGFAGPGRYLKGEDGSPIKALKIALDIFKQHKVKLMKKDFIFVFIEEDKESYESLLNEIKKLALPDEFKVIPLNEKFDVAMEKILGNIKTSLAPTFTFIDPFGTKGVPFSISQKILSYNSCEVFFNFMSSGVIRSSSVTDHTELFGTEEWKEINDLEPSEKHYAFLDLYFKQLKTSAKVKFVRSFNVRNKKNATIFDLIYATNNKVGLEKMKAAMWAADPMGNYTFRDTTDKNQLVLFEDSPDLTPLKETLLHKFSKQSVQIQKIEEFVLFETPYLSTHIKTKTLVPLEKEKTITVNRPSGSRKGYVKGTIINFP